MPNGRVSRMKEINQNGGSSSQEVSCPWPYQMAFWAMLGFQYQLGPENLPVRQILTIFQEFSFSVTWIHYFVLLAPWECCRYVPVSLKEHRSPESLLSQPRHLSPSSNSGNDVICQKTVVPFRSIIIFSKSSQESLTCGEHKRFPPRGRGDDIY